MDTTTILKEIANRVEEAMERAGYNPNSLSDATGIPRTTLNRMLNGHKQFGTIQLLNIASVLDTSFLALVPDELAHAA